MHALLQIRCVSDIKSFFPTPVLHFNKVSIGAMEHKFYIIQLLFLLFLNFFHFQILYNRNCLQFLCTSGSGLSEVKRSSLVL